MKALVERYLERALGASLVDDLRIVLGARFKPQYMLDLKTVRHPDGEMNFRKKRLIKKVKATFKNQNYRSVKEEIYSNARILFVNGIVTSYGLARHQADVLAKCLGQQVQVVHNETEGLVRDLLECNQGRQGVIDPVTEKVIKAIEEKLSDNQPLTIVAYSQGAIISTSALKSLSARLPKEQLKLIRYITFGAGFKDSTLPDEIVCEHFANRLDPVTHLGLQHQDFDYSGELYVRDARGHFFIADYLMPMMAGERYGDSWFEQRLNRENQ